MKSFICNVASVSVAVLSFSAFAALPQPGLWVIDNEVNGKPGRGLQIDRQDSETIVVSYFGYKNDGSAVFYQSVGKVSSDSVFNSDLVEYKNGTVLGGSLKTGEVFNVLGKLNIEFKTDAGGVIHLPHESARNFSKFVYENNEFRLNNSFRITSIDADDPLSFSKTEDMNIRISNGNFYAEKVNSDGWCKYTGSIKSKGINFYSVGTVQCGPDGISAIQYYLFRDINVNEVGVLTMKEFPSFSEPPLVDSEMPYGRDIFGVCISKSQSSRCSASELGLNR